MSYYVIRVNNTKNDSIFYLNSWIFESNMRSVDFTYNLNEAMILPNDDNKVFDFLKGLIQSIRGDHYECSLVRVQRITTIVEPNTNLE